MGVYLAHYWDDWNDRIVFPCDKDGNYILCEDISDPHDPARVITQEKGRFKTLSELRTTLGEAACLDDLVAMTWKVDETVCAHDRHCDLKVADVGGMKFVGMNAVGIHEDVYYWSPSPDVMKLYAGYAAVCDISAVDYRQDCVHLSEGNWRPMLEHMRDRIQAVAGDVMVESAAPVRDRDSFKSRLDARHASVCGLKAFLNDFEEHGLDDPSCVEDGDEEYLVTEHIQKSEYEIGNSDLLRKCYCYDRDYGHTFVGLPPDEALLGYCDYLLDCMPSMGEGEDTIGSIQFEGHEKVEFSSLVAMKEFVRESFTVGMDPKQVHCLAPGLSMDDKYSLVSEMKECRGAVVPSAAEWIAGYQAKQREAMARGRQRNVSDLQVPEENGSGLTAQAEQPAF